MENWILVRSGSRYGLLFREKDGFSLAKTGRYRNRKLEREIAGREIFRESMKEKGHKVQQISGGKIRGVSFGGMEKGDPLYLYPHTGNRMVLLLAEEVSGEWMDAFFADIPRFAPPMDKRKRKQDPDFWRKERQNPEVKQKLKWIPWALGIGGLICTAGYTLEKSPFWLLCGIGFLLVPLLLVIAFPTYFTFMEKPKKKQENYALSLTAPVLLTGFFLMPAVSAFNSQEEWKVYLYAFLLTLAAGLALLLAEEFRRNKWDLWVLLIVFCFSIGVIRAVNETMDPGEPEICIVQILELEQHHRTRGADSFYCTVLLPDGTTDRMQIYADVYEVLEEGDVARLSCFPGALGISYYEILP